MSSLDTNNNIEVGPVFMNILMKHKQMRLDDDPDKCCASCGIEGVGDEKLKKCDGCDLVNYCSDACQEGHRPEHEEACKRRAAELRDDLLLKQPKGRHQGDCPICCLPLPIDQAKFAMTTCCSKRICNGCVYADTVRHRRENRLQDQKCPFCRRPCVSGVGEDIMDDIIMKDFMKRAAANDPLTLCVLGKMAGQDEDYDSAFKYFTRAADLGDADAHNSLSIMLHLGLIEKDEKKEVYHMEEASIAGHPDARYNLGCHEARNGRIERAVKHWIIAANLGFDESITKLRQCFEEGYVSEEDFAAALRAHQDAVNATKSPQREEEEKAYLEKRRT